LGLIIAAPSKIFEVKCTDHSNLLGDKILILSAEEREGRAGNEGVLEGTARAAGNAAQEIRRAGALC
jgi:hypothetical protein